jgi:hypothetical protein
MRVDDERVRGTANQLIEDASQSRQEAVGTAKLRQILGVAAAVSSFAATSPQPTTPTPTTVPTPTCGARV